MPILTGTIDDVTGSPLPDRVSLATLRVTVRAPSRRSSLTEQARLVASVPVPVEVSPTGEISVELEPGPAVMLVEGEGLRDVYELGVTEDMTLLSEALQEMSPTRSWVESQMVQLRAATVTAASEAQTAKSDAEGAASVAEGHRTHVDGIRDLLDEAAQTNVAPYLTQTELNATYPPTAVTAVKVPAALTTEAIQSALTAAKTTGEIVVAGGTITTDQTLTIECDCDLSQLVVNYSGTGTAVRVGTPDGVTWRLSARLPRVRHSGKTSIGWAQVAGTVGVELMNLNSCSEVLVPRVSRFEIGLLETGTNGRGHAYNNVTIGHLENNQRNNVMRSLGTGWCNENLHTGGRFSHEAAEGTDMPGVKHIDIESADSNLVNNNVWLKPSLEGVANEWSFDCRGVYNRIIAGRWERAGGARVRWGAGSSYNVIDGGYHADRIVVTWEPGATRNEINSPNRHEFYGSASDRGIGSFRNTASADAPAWEVLGAGDTWVWRASANIIQGRRTTDTHPRFVLDSVTGKFLLGNGTVAPTAGLGSYGAAGVAPNGNLYFTATNGPILVSPNGTQRRLRLNDNGTLGVVAV